jgi:hypothetical protein
MAGVGMFKLYIQSFLTRKEPDKSMEYSFCSNATNAHPWATKELAQIDGMHIECSPITIQSPQGTPYVCSNFKIEQRAPNEFVIFYEVPFVPVAETAPSGEDDSTAS